MLVLSGNNPADQTNKTRPIQSEGFMMEQYMITEYKNQIDELLKQNNQLQEKISEYENKFSVYTKEQAELYFKIQQVKNDLNQQNLKMSGYNSYKDYNYFELKDFVPCAVKLMVKYGIASHFFVKDGNMYLQIIDKETGAWMQTHTPLKEVPRTKIPIGDVGVLMKDQQAIHTYARRTLWLLVLELVEPILIEQDVDKKEPAKTVDELQLPDELPESVCDVFYQIRKDFGKKIPFQKKQVTNKLKSMKKNKKIDEKTYNDCLGVINAQKS